MFKLIYVTGKRKGRRLTIHGGHVAVGSSDKCGIRAENAGLYTEHAVIEERANGIFVRNLTNTDTVRINNIATKDAILHDGDLIAIGSLRLKFQASGNNLILTGKRRASRLQQITFLAVLLLIAMEIVFIVGGWNIFPSRFSRNQPTPETQPLAIVAKPEKTEESITDTNKTETLVLEANTTANTKHINSADSHTLEKLTDAIAITTGKRKPLPGALNNLHRLLMNIQSEIKKSKNEDSGDTVSNSPG